jgi:hypothetical protein
VIRRGVFAALAAAAVGAVAIPAAQATYPGTTDGRLAFGITVDGNTDVYSRCCRTGTRCIASRTIRTSTPARPPARTTRRRLVPDGMRIATLDWPTRTVEIMNADGRRSRVRPLGIQFVPGWQPRGDRLD